MGPPSGGAEQSQARMVTMFTRLCVDIDAAGNVAGCSYELMDTDGPASIWVGAPGPFDTVHEALDMVLEAHQAQHGVQPSLF